MWGDMAGNSQHHCCFSFEGLNELKPEQWHLDLLLEGSAITILLFNASVSGSGTYLATQLEPNRAVAGSPAALRQLHGLLLGMLEQPGFSWEFMWECL